MGFEPTCATHGIEKSILLGILLLSKFENVQFRDTNFFIVITHT
jgi:5,10-methylenetetrahydrofolate reductase